MKIGGCTFTVQLVHGLSAERRVYGEMSPCERVIRVEALLPCDKQREVLLHEVIEVICNDCDLGLTHPQISTLSLLLHQVLEDNPIFGPKKETNEGARE